MTDVTVKRRRLHPGQQRVKASPARFRICMFGRRWGKNALGVDEAMTAALAGQMVGWFEPTYKYFLESWRDLVSRLTPAAAPGGINEQQKYIKLITGGSIEAWTCDTPDPGRSRRYHLAIINEAGIIRGLKSLWESAIRPTLTDFSGRALFLGTPKGASHDFSVLYRKAEAPLWEPFTGATLENPHIDHADVAQARLDLPPEIFAQEYEGIPAPHGGNPFGLDHIRACTISHPDQLAAIHKLQPRAFGWDFARSHDYTVGIGLADEYEVCRFHRWQGVDWGEQKARIHDLNRAVPAWGDSTRSRVDDVIVQDLQRMGTPIQGVAFSYPVRQALMQRLQVCIHQEKLKIPDGPIIRELESFGYEQTARGVKYTAPDGEHDDCAIALALAVYGRDHFGELPEESKAALYNENMHPGFEWDHKRRKKPWEGGWQPEEQGERLEPLRW